MAATPLGDIHLPERAITALRGVRVEDWINNQAIGVDRPWWTKALNDHGFENTLVGDRISRADIFALAGPANASADAALTLLWNALAWGSGNRHRNNKARIASVAGDRDTANLLHRAAKLSHTQPLAAYDTLYPRNKTAIPALGPAFFTKFLYFAGGGAAEHPCCILDKNVALALNKTCSWHSLPKGNWLATAYERYVTLLGRWAGEHGLHRRDVIERWLFDEGKNFQ